MLAYKKSIRDRYKKDLNEVIQAWQERVEDVYDKKWLEIEAKVNIIF